MWKFLIGLAIVYLTWRLWHGAGPLPGTPRPAPPAPPEPPRRPVAPPRPDAEEQEARAILGVAEDAGPEEIRAAHRRLIAVVHPDRGGSAELTRQINAARDLLLARHRD